MGTIAVRMKIMPSSVKSNLKKIQEDARKLIEGSHGKNLTFTEENIAFGLKAVIAFFAWPENEAIESLETKLSKIKDVSSVQVIDMRRAF